MDWNSCASLLQRAKAFVLRADSIVAHKEVRAQCEVLLARVRVFQVADEKVQPDALNDVVACAVEDAAAALHELKKDEACNDQRSPAGTQEKNGEHRPQQ